MSDAPSFGSQPSANRTANPVRVDVTSEPHDASVETNPGSARASNSGRSRPSRRKLIVLSSLLLVGLAGAAGLGSAGWRIAEQKDAVLTTPIQVAGLSRDDSEPAQETADYLRTGFAADLNAVQSIGAVYTDPAAADRSILLFGGTRPLIWQPERELDRLFDLVVDDRAVFTGPDKVPAGGLGGVMKCGANGADGTSICGWADHGCVAMAIFPDRGGDEAAQLLRKIRSAVQTRS